MSLRNYILEGFGVTLDGKKYKDFESTIQSFKQFRNITDSEFVSLSGKLEEVSKEKPKTVRRYKAKTIEENDDQFIIKQGKTRSIIKKDVDFNTSFMGENMFKSLVNYKSTLEKYEYDTLGYKTELQKAFSSVLFNLEKSKVLIKNKMK